MERDAPLTNLEKVFWPEEGYTKGDLIAYYEQISQVILPYLKDRPMVLNRHPNGINGKSFYQKQAGEIPPFIKTTPVKHSQKTIHYVMVQDKRTLLHVANMGCIELNPFHARVGSLDFPDYAIFDLDPEDLPFSKVIEAAQIIHGLLKTAAIPSYCKTSGGRGLHIYVPFGGQYDYDQAKAFVEVIANIALSQYPRLFSLERSPKKRQGMIYIDIPRNSFSQTLASVYSVRPRPHALVSTPLEWKEVKQGLKPSDFNILSMGKRIKSKGDLFKGLLDRGIDLKVAIQNLEENFELRK